ncbi:MAG TPA: asparagine synthase (glutamine-hydrolyzing) [Pyrinomonadaceae bacterium]|nr:asparagine synthase (glutamine-hydrolyzing) [Acidobacteriota bacterium]HQZ96023.1 asparagine synthase (glutamine-hydrolyzing) [Pyrinomonadaceae bacterium]
MCGIAGWINLKQSDVTHHTEAVLHSMCERIVHRGPNSEGIWMDDTIALGMRRLSIIDLHTGDQPVFSEDKSVIVMMNGELYNYREVRDELEKKGHKFVTKSDTEILPHLYEEYGEDLVDHLNGMYAFSLWDTRKKKLIIARDRFGEKPLYYGIFDGKVLYASEPKAILAHPSVKPELNLDAMRHYLSYDYVPAPHSIYKGISKLPAAHVLTVENGEIKTRRYWNLTFAKSGNTSIEKSAAELKDLLSDAVRMRLVADVPLGVLLSGGVDSSAVAAFATQHATETVKTFSIGFTEDSFDETKYARQVAAHLGTDHHEEILSVAKAAELISDIGSWLDEPMSDGSLIPTYLLARFVRKHVTVALGGDGGDELFAGYPMYYAHKVAKLYSTVPGFVRSGLIEPIVRSLPVSTKNLSFEYKAKRFVRASKYDTVTRHHSWFGSFTPDEQKLLLTEHALKNSSGDIYAGARDLLKLCDATSEIEQMQYLDMNFYMAEDILTKVDRASMAVSLETRAPFLDPRVGQFAASLPLDYKLRGSKGKHILKRSLEGLLPSNILHRSKKGFGIPIAEWLKTLLNPLMHDMLAPERLNAQGIFESDYVQKLIAEHEKGVASHHKQLWTMLVFQLWQENFLNPGMPA